MNARTFPDLPLELEEIGLLASEALAATVKCRNQEPKEVARSLHHPSLDDWVFLSDNLVALSKDFLSRSNECVAANKGSSHTTTLLMHALTQRCSAAMNPNAAFGAADWLATARSFLAALRVHEVMDYHLRSNADVETMSNGAILASTVSAGCSLGNYLLSVEKIKVNTRTRVRDSISVCSQYHIGREVIRNIC